MAKSSKSTAGYPMFLAIRLYSVYCKHGSPLSAIGDIHDVINILLSRRIEDSMKEAMIQRILFARTNTPDTGHPTKDVIPPLNLPSETPLLADPTLKVYPRTDR